MPACSAHTASTEAGLSRDPPGWRPGSDCIRTAAALEFTCLASELLCMARRGHAKSRAPRWGRAGLVPSNAAAAQRRTCLRRTTLVQADNLCSVSISQQALTARQLR